MKNDYSVGLREFFRETVKKLGGEIVAEESYAEGDIEFKAQLTEIKAAESRRDLRARATTPSAH